MLCALLFMSSVLLVRGETSGLGELEYWNHDDGFAIIYEAAGSINLQATHENARVWSPVYEQNQNVLYSLVVTYTASENSHLRVSIESVKNLMWHAWAGTSGRNIVFKENEFHGRDWKNQAVIQIGKTPAEWRVVLTAVGQGFIKVSFAQFSLSDDRLTCDPTAGLCDGWSVAQLENTNPNFTWLFGNDSSYLGSEAVGWAVVDASRAGSIYDVTQLVSPFYKVSDPTSFDCQIHVTAKGGNIKIKYHSLPVLAIRLEYTEKEDNSIRYLKDYLTFRLKNETIVKTFNVNPNSLPLDIDKLRIIIEADSTREGIKGFVGVKNINISSGCFPVKIPLWQSARVSSSDDNASYLFTTCGATGQKGPTQQQCDKYYEQRERNLVKWQPKVSLSDDMPGVQKWVVPKNKTYRLLALGAHGGFGSETKRTVSLSLTDSFYMSQRADLPVWPSWIAGNINLTAGWELYIVAGQAGAWGCADSSSVYCKGSLTAMDFNDTGGGEGEGEGGGGGGGGASLVALKRSPYEELELILLANGGGGMGRYDVNDTLDYMKALAEDKTNNGNSIPGAGKSYENFESTSSAVYFTGLIGGKGCNASRAAGFEAHGGFGGGGGGCSAGGGGGGYAGGKTSQSDKPWLPGAPGSSYINELLVDTVKVDFQPMNYLNTPAGYVEITEQPLECPSCKTGGCKWLDTKYKDFECICTGDYVLSEDKRACEYKGAIASTSEIVEGKLRSFDIIIVAVVTVVAFCLVVVGIVYFICRKYYRKQRHGHLKISETTTSLLPRSGQVILAPTMMDNTLYLACSEQQMIPPKNITFTGFLGEGEFSKVYKAKLNDGSEWNSTETDVAVKIPKSQPDQTDSVTNQEFIDEAAMISFFDHKNIIKILGVCNDLPYIGNRSTLAIIMELLTGGDLKSFLASNRPTKDAPVSDLTLGDLIQISRDVASACAYLEENKFIHRDIAARNVLLSEKGNERIAKIGDFGRSRDIGGGEYVTRHQHRKKPAKWLSPEAINDYAQSTKSDVWSFGVLLWEIFTMGELPYPDQGGTEACRSVLAGLRMQPPGLAPTQIADVMRHCWMYSPIDRPSFASIFCVINTVTKDPRVMEKSIAVSQLIFERELKRSVTSSTSSDEDRIDSPTSSNSSDPLLRMQDVTLQRESHHTDAA